MRPAGESCYHAAVKITTAEQMRDIDRRASEEYGLPSLVLMENAGREVAAVVQKLRRARGNESGYYSATVVAGPGNNGGDGFVAARYLVNAGCDVRVIVLSQRAKMRGDAAVMMRLVERMEVPVHFAHTVPLWDEVLDWLYSADVVIDAVFGTGLRAPVADDFFAAVMDDINHAPGEIVAVDIPSGLSADTGDVSGPAVQATATVWLGFPKYAHVLPPAEAHCGELHAGDLGLPPRIAAEAGVHAEWVTPDIVQPYFGVRDRDTHKGQYGHVLVIGGSRGKLGAALLAAKAALRAGAGAATLAVPESLLDAAAAKFPEVMVEPLPDTGGGGIAEGALVRALDLVKGKTAVAIGPGLGLHPETRAFVSSFVRQCPATMVVDADALNALARADLDASPLDARNADVVLTPHPGEMARLMSTSVEDVQGRRLEVAAALAKKHHAVVSLKGHRTVCAMPDGYLYINSTGNPGMATAGTGDVLAGVIAGLAANSRAVSVPAAAFTGVYWHGLAGDLAAEHLSEAALTAGDILDHLPAAALRIMGRDVGGRDEDKR